MQRQLETEGILSSLQHSTADSDANFESREEEDIEPLSDSDFDMEVSRASIDPERVRQERSTSKESRRPANPKLDLEDENILANPELYGLRRRVRHRR